MYLPDRGVAATPDAWKCAPRDCPPFAGRASSLKVFKKDVDTVGKGSECGLGLDVRYANTQACTCCPDTHKGK